MPASDDVLDWELLRSADESAFTSLFERHRDRIYNFCFRRLSDWSRAEDATQAVFLQLWRRARAGQVEALRGDTALPVLFTMAHQECLTQQRTLARRTSLTQRLRQVRTRERCDADEWLQAEHTMQLIREALATLPEGQREVIELVCWAEMSIAEAAATLGVAEGTIKSRLSRARTTLAGSPAAHLVEADHA